MPKENLKLQKDAKEFKSERQPLKLKTDSAEYKDKDKEKKSLKLKINSDSYHAVIAKEKEENNQAQVENEEQEDFKEFKLRKLDQEALTTSFKEQSLSQKNPTLTLEEQKPAWNQRK